MSDNNEMVLIKELETAAAEITRLRARLDEAEAAKADAWDECVKAALQQVPYTSQAKRSPYESGFVEGVKVCDDAIRALVNPYRSKTDEPQ